MSDLQTLQEYFCNQYYKIYNEIKTESVVIDIEEGKTYKNIQHKINSLRDLAPPISDNIFREFWHRYKNYKNLSKEDPPEESIFAKHLEEEKNKLKKMMN